MKGYGSVVRIKASQGVKQNLARKLVPVENVANKYSATANTQMNLPFTSDLTIPMSTERLREAYQGRLSDFEISVVRPVMLNVIAAIKHSLYTGAGYAMIAHSSKILSPFLWDVVVLWLKRCGYMVQEDIREVVLVEDCQNQGRTRVKLLFGARISWSRKVEDQIALIKSLQKMEAYE